MDSIAEALIIAIQYLGNDRNDEEYTEDDDLKIVEAVASIIQDATLEEKDSLKRVSEKMGLSKWTEQMGVN